MAEIQEYRLNMNCAEGIEAELTGYHFSRDGDFLTDAFGAVLDSFTLGPLNCPPDDVVTNIVLADLPNDFVVYSEQVKYQKEP